MYPDLSYFFHDLLGTDVDNFTSIFKTFGVMLVLALMACGVFLKYELKRLEAAGKIHPIKVFKNTSERISALDIAVNSAIMFFLGAKIPIIFSNFKAFQADPASVIFSKIGNWGIGILVGALSAAYFIYKNSKTPDTSNVKEEYLQYPSEKTNNIIMIAGFAGVLGSKLFSITENLSGFFKNPLGSLFSGSGLNIYGGLILAFIAVYWYIKKLGIKPLYMMDIAGMGILLGYAIGRIGCQLSGDGDWGIEASAMPSWWFLPDWMWSFNYPHNVNNDGSVMSNVNQELFNTAIAQRASIEEACQTASGMRYCHEITPKVYPTPLYETIFGFISFGILFLFRNTFKITGTIFFIYMILNGIERFFIEFIRVNDRYDYFGVHWSQAQYISILFVIIGIVGLIWLYRKGNNQPSKA